MNYAKLFTKRKNGLYQTAYKDADGKWRTIAARDPKVLYDRLQKLKKTAPMTVAEIVAEWLSAHEQEVSYKTQESYRAPVRRIEEELGAKVVADVTPQDLQGFIVWLSGRGYSRRTVQLHRDILTMAFRYGVYRGYIQSNPAAELTIPKGLPSSRRDAPEDAALEAVQRCTDAPFALYALVLMYTGLRRGEALGLRYEDIDRRQRIIHVRRSVQYRNNDPVIKTPKTSAGVRDVYFPAALLSAIPKQKTGYVFARENGDMLTREAFMVRWERYCEAIGYKITSHQLRHYYATAMFEAGVPVLAAQAQLGHANATTTLNIYTHLRERKRQEAYNKIDEYFSKSSGA